jgi:hypothetical protein
METQHINNSIPQFSFFRKPVFNQVPYKNVTAVEVNQVITGSYYEKATLHLRNITDKKEANKFKCKRFDFACFSGTFARKNEKQLIKHSGLICLDFDNQPNKEKLREKLMTDQYLQTILLFTSPTGTGLKWIVKIDLNQGTHIENFQALENYIFETYQVKIDSSGKDVARPCFLPYDPDCYFNQSPEEKYLNVANWMPIEKPFEKVTPYQPRSEQRKVTGKQKTFFDVLNEIEFKQIDIAPMQNQWLNIGFILADYFGENGREYFKRISSFYNGSINRTPDKQYDYCLNGNRKGAVRLNTFFQYAKEAGIEI